MKTIKLTHEDGTEREYTLGPMPVSRFEAAFEFAGDRHNELRLLDLAFNQPPGWSKTLSAPSFTVAVEAMYGECVDFFGAAARRIAWRVPGGMAGSGTSQS